MYTHTYIYIYMYISMRTWPSSAAPPPGASATHASALIQ